MTFVTIPASFGGNCYTNTFKMKPGSFTICVITSYHGKLFLSTTKAPFGYQWLGIGWLSQSGTYSRVWYQAERPFWCSNGDWCSCTGNSGEELPTQLEENDLLKEFMSFGVYLLPKVNIWGYAFKMNLSIHPQNKVSIFNIA